jgi:hypothetical protein
MVAIVWEDVVVVVGGVMGCEMSGESGDYHHDDY